MSYPQLDDVEFHGGLAVMFATRTSSGPHGWQGHVSQVEREYIIRKQAELAAHLANWYLTGKPMAYGRRN